MVRNCKKMGFNTKLKILNIISGAKYGGAESFFERLAISFAKNQEIDQKILIRSNRERIKKLKKVTDEVEQLVFFNSFNPFCSYKIEQTIKEFNHQIFYLEKKLTMKLRLEDSEDIIKLKIILNVTS